jgi:fructokinase
VGTGIGGGVIVNGRPHHGRRHPEFGHLRVARQPRDSFSGLCPSHGDCLEGLASGPALAARWGAPAEGLPEEHPAWEIEAHYLAEGVAALTYVLSPDVVVIGRR